jgi:hypothetical protein
VDVAPASLPLSVCPVAADQQNPILDVDAWATVVVARAALDNESASMTTSATRCSSCWKR